MTTNAKKEIKLELIAPFIKATHHIFHSMLGMDVTRKNAYVKKGFRMYGDISGIIGMSGDTAGTCAISLPADLAIHCVETMLCEEIGEGVNSAIVRDGVGELINMIAGAAKATLANSRYHFDITLPTLISGQGHEIFHRPGTHCAVIKFETPEGTLFTLDVCVQDKKKPGR